MSGELRGPVPLLVTVCVVESLLIQTTASPTDTRNVCGEKAIAAMGAPGTISTSAAPEERLRRMTPAPMEPATMAPMTNPMTANVNKPPVDCGVARDRLCISPVFALRNDRRENRTTRIVTETPDIDSQNPESTGFFALSTMNVLNRRSKTTLDAAPTR